VHNNCSALAVRHAHQAWGGIDHRKRVSIRQSGAAGQSGALETDRKSLYTPFGSSVDVDAPLGLLRTMSKSAGHTGPASTRQSSPSVPAVCIKQITKSPLRRISSMSADGPSAVPKTSAGSCQENARCAVLLSCANRDAVEWWVSEGGGWREGTGWREGGETRGWWVERGW
jgi:hypothetical protein